MTILLAAGLVVFAAATAVVVRANLRVYRERRRWQADKLTAESMLAYHAWRSQQIRDGLDALGDDAQYVFPPRVNGR